MKATQLIQESQKLIDEHGDQGVNVSRLGNEENPCSPVPYDRFGNGVGDKEFDGAVVELYIH